jgi:hypothetical protein
MQNFLRFSFGIFLLSFIGIAYLFTTALNPQKQIEQTVNSDRYSQLVAQIPIELIAVQLEKNRSENALTYRRSRLTQDEFDLVILRQSRTIRQRIESMQPGEAFAYFESLLISSLNALQNPRATRSQHDYHMRLLEILYKEGLILASNSP